MKTLKISSMSFDRDIYEFNQDVEIIIDEPIPKGKKLIVKIIPVEENYKEVISPNINIGSIGS